jgi:hypothetical protein
VAKSIRCYACRAFFDIKNPACSECDAPRRGRNAYLETAKLNRQLFAQAEHADGERRQAAAVARGADPPAWAKRQAAQLIDHL